MTLNFNVMEDYKTEKEFVKLNEEAIETMSMILDVDNKYFEDNIQPFLHIFKQHLIDTWKIVPADRWSKVEQGKQPVEGKYWVFVDGSVDTAIVNPMFLPKRSRGFWQYFDAGHDVRLKPTHYMPYEQGMPPAPGEHNTKS